MAERPLKIVRPVDENPPMRGGEGEQPLDLGVVRPGEPHDAAPSDSGRSFLHAVRGWRRDLPPGTNFSGLWATCSRYATGPRQVSEATAAVLEGATVVTRHLAANGAGAMTVGPVSSDTPGLLATADPVEVGPHGEMQLEVTWTVSHCAAAASLSSADLRYRIVTERESVELITPIGTQGLLELVRLVERECGPGTTTP